MSWFAVPAVPVAGFAILFGMARVERWLTQVGAAAPMASPDQTLAAPSPGAGNHGNGQLLAAYTELATPGPPPDTTDLRSVRSSSASPPRPPTAASW